MKFIFFGAGTFGLPILEALRKSSHVLEAVVTTPDKPQGRGRAVLPSPLKVWTQEKGVPVLPLTHVNAPKSLERLKELEPDIFVVASFGTILSDAFLELPPPRVREHSPFSITQTPRRFTHRAGLDGWRKSCGHDHPADFFRT